MVVVPAAHGWIWLRDGFRLFRRSPGLWMMLMFAYWVLMTLVGLVPYVGIAVGLALVPAFSVSFMNIARAAERGLALEPGLLLSGFREQRPALMLLGGVYFVSLVAILTLTQFVDGGILMRGMLFAQDIPVEALKDPRLPGAALTALALYAPVMAAMWFAPMLAAWHGMAVPKALFFSFFACLANWRAFAIYGVAVALFAGVVPWLLLVVIAAMLHTATAGKAMVPLAGVGVFMVLAPILFASFYASYRDVFPPEPPDLPTPAGT